MSLTANQVSQALFESIKANDLPAVRHMLSMLEMVQNRSTALSVRNEVRFGHIKCITTAGMRFAYAGRIHRLAYGCRKGIC